MSEEKIDVLGIRSDYNPVSSPDGFERFMEGSIYKDFQGELSIRIEQLRDVLEVSDSKMYLKTQGAIAFARTMQDIFNNLLANRIMDLEANQLNQRGE